MANVHMVQGWMKRADNNLNQGAEEKSDTPVDGGGRGPHDPSMEARVTKLELIAEQTEKRFDRMQSTLDRIEQRLASMPTVGGLWGMIATVIGVSLAVLAIVAAIFAWRQDQIIALSSQSEPAAPIVIHLPSQTAPTEEPVGSQQVPAPQQ